MEKKWELTDGLISVDGALAFRSAGEVEVLVGDGVVVSVGRCEKFESGKKEHAFCDSPEEVRELGTEGLVEDERAAGLGHVGDHNVSSRDGLADKVGAGEEVVVQDLEDLAAGSLAVLDGLLVVANEAVEGTEPAEDSWHVFSVAEGDPLEDLSLFSEVVA